MESKEDSFVWNRLGNLYYKGGRADLAACAYEHSLALNPKQTESHFSLGMILSAIGEVQEAANYLHKMLISASSYRQMNASDLRNLLSNGLRELFHLNTISNGAISVPPPIELYSEFQINIPNSEEGSTGVLEGEIVTDDLTSFFPSAELFMGERSKELPGNKKYFKKKKKKKRKKKRTSQYLEVETCFSQKRGFIMPKPLLSY
ncbi:tetratricopeptide repeat protein [Alkalihalobacillus sp. 1P02AB]|uniref:tetratricopeptide repeat protein n=1 Tax=Alkalihalobacillus sp. 1P02AB TaxID=3132260 RepID=UPI0039A568BA